MDGRLKDGCILGAELSFDLTTADADAMDAVLSLLPEARLAAVAVARAASRTGVYPIRSASELAAAIGSGGIDDGEAHKAGTTLFVDYMAPGDLPIEGPIDLAGVVLSTLNRCRRHQQLRESLAQSERGLDERDG